MDTTPNDRDDDERPRFGEGADEPIEDNATYDFHSDQNEDGGEQRFDDEPDRVQPDNDRGERERLPARRDTRNLPARAPAHNKNHNQVRYKVEPINHVDMSDVRAFTRGKKCFRYSPKTMQIIVETPYDKELNAAFYRIGGELIDKRFWHFHISKMSQLEFYANRVEALAELEHADRVQYTGRIAEGDQRIWVKDSDIADYQVGYLVFRDAKEWIITYIALPHHYPDGVKYPVYIRLLTSKAQVDTSHQ